jgi:glycosyltransferase involved in cell wall biosynthesis
MGEAMRRATIKQVDWWFAYTGMSRDIVVGSGFSGSRVTTVNNSLDTCELISAKKNVEACELDALRKELHLASDNIAIYCGGMYAHKRLSFLLAACEIIRAAVNDFHIIFIGDGPDSALVESASRLHPWIHYIGSKYGAERAPYFLLSKLMLMPGQVGLAIIDSFVFGTPLVTTNNGIHSPEIEYLKQGSNGLMTDDDVASYAQGVINLFRNDEWRDGMVLECESDCETYTVENMVKNFVDGVRACLDE